MKWNWQSFSLPDRDTGGGGNRAVALVALTLMMLDYCKGRVGNQAFGNEGANLEAISRWLPEACFLVVCGLDLGRASYAPPVRSGPGDV